MSKRSDFMVEVTNQIMENPRAVLAGHGINAAVLQRLIERPDAMSKLASILYSTKYATKGASGLKKSGNFSIKGYKTFGNFIDMGREDIENFIEKLGADDQAKFKNSENIVCIIMEPDTDNSTGDETVEDKIISGGTTILPFEVALKKGIGTPKAAYLMVMMGDSAERPQEVKKAEVKKKTNASKRLKRTPAKIKAELKAKMNKKLAIIDKKRGALEQQSYRTSKELEQFSQLGSRFGANTKNPMMVKNAMKVNDSEAIQKAGRISEIIDGLDEQQAKLLDEAKRYYKKGKFVIAKAYLKELGIPELTDYVKNGLPTTSNEVVNQRKKELKDAISRLTMKNEQLLVDLSLAPENKKLSVRSMISKNTGKIKEYRAKLGTYKNLSAKAMMNKATMLKATNSAIEGYIAEGKNLQQALNSAIAELDASPAQKQIIKQQVIQQVAEGMPMQYAVQQSLQDNLSEEPINVGATLTGSSTIEDILAKL